MLKSFGVLLFSLWTVASSCAANWEPIGPFGGVVTAIAIHPLGSVLYAAGQYGSIFKSTNGGASWFGANNGLPRLPLCIAVSPDDPNVAYAGFLRKGIFKTTNGGQSWLKAGSTQSITSIAIHPNNPAVVLAGDWNGKIFRSENGGMRWTGTYVSPLSNKITSIHFAPSNPNVVYASSSSEVFRSTNSGLSWQKLFLEGDVLFIDPKLAVDPGNPDHLLVADYYRIWASTDAGVTWEEAYSNHVEDIAFQPQNPNIVVGSGIRSTDGGQSWSETVSTPACVPFRIVPDPSDANRVFATSGYDGFFGKGICVSTDQGVTWLPTNNGLQNTIVVHYALDPHVRNRIFVQTGESNGLFVSADAGVNWSDTGVLSGNFGAAILVHPSIPDLIFAGGSKDPDYDSAFLKSTDGGETFDPMIGAPFPFWTLTVDPFDGQTLYVPISDGLRISQDGGSSWSPLIDVSADEIVADPQTPGILYADNSNGSGVSKSTDGGANWFPINDGLGDLVIQHLTMDPTDPLILYASTYTALYKTTNGGSHWDILHSGTHFDVLVHPDNSKVLFAASLKGVLFSSDGGIVWHSAGLRTEGVTTLALDPFDKSILYAATFGHGIYRTRVRLPKN